MNTAAATEMPTFFSTASDMRARPCSSSACAISWPMIEAISSSVSLSASRMPVKKAILPPGMQNAFTLFELMRFTSHFQRCASLLKRSDCGMRSRAMRRRRATCAGSRLRAFFCCAARISWPYCCAALFSTVEAGSSSRPLFFTSTPSFGAGCCCASAVPATATQSANAKRRFMLLPSRSNPGARPSCGAWARREARRSRRRGCRPCGPAARCRESRRSPPGGRGST